MHRHAAPRCALITAASLFQADYHGFCRVYDHLPHYYTMNSAVHPVIYGIIELWACSIQNKNINGSQVNRRIKFRVLSVFFYALLLPCYIHTYAEGEWRLFGTVESNFNTLNVAIVPAEGLLWKIGAEQEIALQIKRSLHESELIIGPRPFHSKRDASYLHRFTRLESAQINCAGGSLLAMLLTPCQTTNFL